MEQHIPDRSRQDLGRTNRRAVLGELVLRGPLSRTAIAQRTGLTGASVSRITRELINAGLIRETDAVTKTGRPGRRFIELDVDPAGGFVLGIGLNVFQQSVTLADLKNNRIDRRDLSLPDLSDPAIVIARIIDVAEAMINDHVADWSRLFGGSLAITGAVDPITGVVRESPYLGWGQVDLAARLEQGLGLPFRIENLPNAINLAEARFGASREKSNVLLFNTALGIGGSIYLDGRLARGTDFMAGLAGGLIQGGAGGAGKTLDDLAGGRGLLLATGMSETEVDALPADMLAASLLSLIGAANAGEAEAGAIVADGGRVLGEALAMFAGLVRPETIILSGPLSRCGRYVRACERAFRAAGGEITESIPLVISDLSAQAAARWQAIGEFLVDRSIDLGILANKEAA